MIYAKLIAKKANKNHKTNRIPFPKEIVIELGLFAIACRKTKNDLSKLK